MHKKTGELRELQSQRGEWVKMLPTQVPEFDPWDACKMWKERTDSPKVVSDLHTYFGVHFITASYPHHNKLNFKRLSATSKVCADICKVYTN